MISNVDGSLDENLGHLHSALLGITDWHARAKVSHDFLKYVFSSLSEELVIEDSDGSQVSTLIDHLITSFLAENECFLHETKVLIEKARKDVMKLKSR